MRPRASKNPIFNEQKVSVSGGHTLWIEQSGNPNGIPVLYIHGGPGAGLGRNYQWPFDLEKYRIIAFDQRGSGRSTPFAETQNNDTSLLLQDIDWIRQHLNIDKWVVFGGSWGSTLALLSAISQPETILHLVLRGVFLARQEDFDWFLSPQGGAAQVFPEAYEAFSQNLHGATCTKQICEQYTAMFNQSNEQSFAALSDWYNWEGFISRIITPNYAASDVSSDHQVIGLALLECHYLLNHCFIEENYIINNAHKIAHLPCNIVHGRYDMVCKLEAAYTLQKHMPNAELMVVNNAGHSMSEPEIGKVLINIMHSVSQLNEIL